MFVTTLVILFLLKLKFTKKETLFEFINLYKFSNFKICLIILWLMVYINKYETFKMIISKVSSNKKMFRSLGKLMIKEERLKSSLNFNNFCLGYLYFDWVMFNCYMFINSTVLEVSRQYHIHCIKEHITIKHCTNLTKNQLERNV